MNRPGDSKPRPNPRLQPASAVALCLALGLAALSASGHPDEASKPSSPADPLAAEIARWSGFLATHPAPASDETWTQIKTVATPVMAAAEKALADGRRLLALQRLAAVRSMLAATVYVGEHTGAESKDEAAFEAEWQRMGSELASDLGPTAPGSFEGIRPAAVRAVAEAAQPQIRGCYDASLDYGKSTDLESGLFYLGNARAQRDLAAFCRRLSIPAASSAGAPPKLRPLAHEIDDLQARLLTAYRPPASLDRHGEFIGANATLNEARQLDAAGLRAGALLRYLEAALRAAPLLSTAPPAAEPPLSERLAAFESRLASGETDHSIGRIFLERAQADVASNAPPGKATPSMGEAIAADVLPRYFAALGPSSPRPVPPAPAVTVTLVRWPYT